MKNVLTKVIVRKGDRVRVSTINNKPEKGAQQQFKEQCDVNNIIAKYKRTGEWQHVTGKQGQYADVSEMGDYHSSLQKTIDAQNAFMTLPAKLRVKFNNDPGELLEFMQDPKNLNECIELGLYEKPMEAMPNPIPNDDLNDDNVAMAASNKKTTTNKTTTTKKGSTNLEDL